eukprot:806664-Pyramimonas_sp.AAC.1
MRTCVVPPSRTTGGKKEEKEGEEEEVEEEERGKNASFDYQNFPGVAFTCPHQILTYMLLLPILCTQALVYTSAALHADAVV